MSEHPSSEAAPLGPDALRRCAAKISRRDYPATRKTLEELAEEWQREREQLREAKAQLEERTGIT